MRSLAAARAIARDARVRIGEDSRGLLARLESYFWTECQLDVVSVPASAINDSRGELRVAEGCVYYDEALDADPTQKLIVLAHELGHLLLHPRVHSAVGFTDPILGSAYLADGAGAIARYSAKMREEAEANAFALEFLCPAPDVFARWRFNADESADRIATEIELPIDIVRAQLAEGFYGHVLGQDEIRETHRGEWPLKEYQKRAAERVGVPVLVNAGPGTGKTATLVGRVAFLLGELHEAPANILILTFSNDAAEELRERLASRFGDAIANQLTILTFHAFGVEFLRLHGKFVELDAEPVILDEAAQQELVLELLGRCGCDAILNLREPEETAEQAVDSIAFCKDRGLGPAEVKAALRTEHAAGTGAPDLAREEAFLALFETYEAERQKRSAVDFGDLILLPLLILRSEAQVREAYREKYRWIMVDEYQDVGRSVAELLEQLAGPANPPWVVGDKRQAIYRFRGAHPENVDEFVHKFPGAETYDLEENHRSCEVIVEAANQLATLLADPSHTGGEWHRRWRSAFDGNSVGEVAIRIAEARSDVAEYAGIVAQVESWQAEGVQLRDIAILARRNIDVRNVVLALGRRGIAATTNGIVTAEGAAGDLAAVLTLPDAPTASLPRVAMALARGDITSPLREDYRTSVNAAIEVLVAGAASKVATEAGQSSSGQARADDQVPRAFPALSRDAQMLVDRAGDVMRHLTPERHRSDAFDLLLGFLFDASGYLRRALEMSDAGERALTLSEVVTVLAMAAGHRFTHSALAPRHRRLGFAQYLRRKLCGTVEALVPPRSQADAVRVMTCHASKGLEFSCVVVSGQTLSQARGNHEWLPKDLRPKREDDVAQAESLLFVGVTRAKQALVVSHSPSKSGSGFRPRSVTPLLARWQQCYSVPAVAWDGEIQEEAGSTIGPIWGDRMKDELPARELDEKSCNIRTYLEYGLGLEFPSIARPLYPLFVGRLRRILQGIAQCACEAGGRADSATVVDIINGEWPTDDELTREHPHAALYRQQVVRAAQAFANDFIAQPGWRRVDIELSFTPVTADGSVPQTGSGASRPVPRIRTDLVAVIEREGAGLLAVAVNVDSLVDAVSARDGGVNWSKIKPYRRLPFALLRSREPALDPRVFSVVDGKLYALNWKVVRKGSGTVEDEATEAITRLVSISAGIFAKTASDFWCDRCGYRILCPHWMGLAEPTDEAVEGR